MNDHNNEKKLPRSLEQITLHEQWEIDYWTEFFQVNETQLRIALIKAGNSVEKIKEYLDANYG